MTATTPDRPPATTDGGAGDVVRDIAALEAVYGPFPDAGLLKESPVITPLQRRWIEASPFVVLATVGPEGMDASPRGDAAPVVTIVDERTLHLPDRRGNNRLDSLRNIVRDGRVGLLFLVPGLGATMRLNGRAVLRTDPGLLARYAVRGASPATVVEIRVESVYTHCPKALVRSRLWDPAGFRATGDLPLMGAIRAEVTPDGAFDGDAWDRAYPARIPDELY